MSKSLPTTLKGDVHSNDVYFRLYHLKDKGFVTIVCMQEFDEYDYHEEMFVKNESGDRYYFMEEDHAIQQLNIWFESDQIDPQYAISSDHLTGLDDLTR